MLLVSQTDHFSNRNFHLASEQTEAENSKPRDDFLKAVYLRRGLTCTIALANDLIDGGQPRAKNGF